MNYKAKKLDDDTMRMICSWFSNTISCADKLTTGNVAHQGRTIRNHAIGCLSYIADYLITDDWHEYDRKNYETAPKHGELLLTHIEGGGYLVQSFNEHYGRFEDNNCVDKYKHITFKYD